MIKSIVLIVSLAITGGAFADPPKLYSSNGKYLGTLSSNKYDPNSVSNEYGRYGSKYSPDSINNEYGKYGSQYSNDSPSNPYATNPPRIVHDE